MKTTFNIQFCVYGPAQPGQSAQHRPMVSSGSKNVLAGDADGNPAIVNAIKSLLLAHPEATITGVQQAHVIDLES